MQAKTSSEPGTRALLFIYSGHCYMGSKFPVLAIRTPVTPRATYLGHVHGHHDEDKEAIIAELALLHRLEPLRVDPGVLEHLADLARSERHWVFLEEFLDLGRLEKEKAGKHC